jgi:hypothetical protein
MPTRLLVAVPALAAALVLSPARAETIGGNPGPEHNYVCPHSDGKPALDCYFDAVQHLYTMCRNVKSIEIIEFGYDKSTEGTNGAKSESCLDKQKQNIAPPYKAALKEAGKSKPVQEALRGLQESWLSAMSGLGWHSGESDADYKTRVARPYEEFTQRIETIRTSLAEVETKAAAARAAKAARPKHSATSAPPAKAKTAKAKKH